MGASICGKGKERGYLEHLYFLDKILKENAILIVVQTMVKKKRYISRRSFMQSSFEVSMSDKCSLYLKLATSGTGENSG